MYCNLLLLLVARLPNKYNVVSEQLTSESVHDWDDQMWLIDDEVGVTRPVTS